MIKAKRIETSFEDKKSTHTFYYQDDSSCLAVIFPGGGNSCDRPILHYLRSFLLSNNVDVLNISYTNLVNNEDSSDVQMERLVNSIMEALNQVMSDKIYRKKMFISRSAGNIISNELKIKKDIQVDKTVYISPTKDATKYLDTYPGLIITGTNDYYISDTEVNDLVEKYKEKVLVFDQGTHSLENEDIEKTLDFCKKSVTMIMDYLLG